ncbi:MAG: lipocalin family protein [Bacteroidia bacterium]
MTKLILSVVAVAAITFSGCKKDKESNTDKLTDKNWKMTALTVDPPLGGILTDVYAQIQACTQDDLTIFKDDHSVNFDEGASKCDAADPQTTTGSWAYNSDETVVTVVDDGGFITSYTITSLSSSEMKGTFTDNSSGIVETYSVTFKAQ